MLRIENIVFVVAVLATLSLLMIQLLIHSTILRMIIALIILAIIIFLLRALTAIFLKKLKELEFEADEYAFRRLQESFQLADPCQFINDLFNVMTEIQSDPQLRNKIKFLKFQEIVIKLVGLEDGYHPTNDERVNRLKIIAKCNGSKKDF